jgi:hypothetical protein
MNKKSEIQLLAETFLSAYRRCSEPFQIENTQFEVDRIPAIVCLAFSTELYLRAVLEYKNLCYKKTHSLKTLFKSLSKKSQRMIMEKSPFISEVFNNFLSDADNAFIDWRYIYQIEDNQKLAINCDFLEDLIAQLESILSGT